MLVGLLSRIQDIITIAVAVILANFANCKDSPYFLQESQRPYYNPPISYNYPSVNNYDRINNFEDLQTSDLPFHLQHALPQYHPQQSQRLDNALFFNQRSYVLPNLGNKSFKKNNVVSQNKKQPDAVSYKKNDDLIEIPLKLIQNTPKNNVDKQKGNFIEFHTKPTTISTSISTSTSTTTTTTTQSEYDELGDYYDEYTDDIVISTEPKTSNEQNVTEVSVKISKSIGTSASQLTTQAPLKVDNSSENWMIVASVQTSRSVSGARFLSFPLTIQLANDTKVANNSKKDTEKLNENNKIRNKIVMVADISKFLPVGYKLNNNNNTTTTDNNTIKSSSSTIVPKKENNTAIGRLSDNVSHNNQIEIDNDGKSYNKSNSNLSAIKPKFIEDISRFLPADFVPINSNKLEKEIITVPNNTTIVSATSTTVSTATKNPSKIVFPTRPGNKKPIYRTTTPKIIVSSTMISSSSKLTPKLKEWPKRQFTQFTGWSVPTAIPISIEKLLEAARKAAVTVSDTLTTTTATTFSSTSSTKKPLSTTKFPTTTNRPTTPGICSNNCDLAATVKLVGGAKWVPELLNRNTKEWQILANEVQTKLEEAFSRSDMLHKWYKKIRIEEFSEGSVLVDYYVELTNVQDDIDTKMIKKMFHDSLFSSFVDDNDNNENVKLSLGHFVIDPNYTDFMVIPKRDVSNIKHFNDDDLLPQWAIAVIVIGLASLIFVALFGLSVLINRKKNTKIKQRIPFTEEMIQEYNKNHMGGFDNYGVEDLYNMEDVWNEKPYDIRNVNSNNSGSNKKKQRLSSSSLHDNSLSHLYDSWRSEWNGYYLNAYHNGGYSNRSNYYGSSVNGPNFVPRKKPDYDTNF